MNTVRLMVDLETLDVVASAVILQIGACVIEEKDNYKGENDMFCANLNWREQQQYRTTSVDTVLWWGQQPDEIRDFVMNGKDASTVTLVEGLDLFSRWVFDRKLAYGATRFELWSNGGMDADVLCHAYDQKKFQSQVPLTNPYATDYRCFRDFRTVRDQACNQYGMEHDAPNEAAHTALGDAIWQAKTLLNIERNILKRMNKNG